MQSSPENKKVLFPEYRYRCVNESFVEPRVKKYYVRFFLPFIPRWFSANLITLISCSAMWTMFYLAFRDTHFTPEFQAMALAFLLHFYMVGDILDGMHAKNTGTSSPLGEFLDHYLDTYNSAILFAACFILLQIQNTTVFYILLWLSYLAFAVTMVGEKERGELYFGRIGSLEGVVALLLFLVSLSFSGGQNFWHAELWNGYQRYWVIIIAGGFGYLVTVGDTLRRIGYCPRPFILFSMGSLLLTLLLARSSLSSLLGWFFLAFYCGDYICRVMESYFLNKNHPYPDLPATAGILLLLIESYLHLLPASWDDKPILALGIYIGIRSLWGLGKAFYGLRRYWLWTNP